VTDSSSGNGLVSHTRWGSCRQGAYMHRFITGVTAANTAIIALTRAGPGVARTSCSGIGQNSGNPPHAPVVPEYSYHIRRTPMRVSREPTSGFHRQAVRVTTVAVAAVDALLSMPPGASLTTWSQTVRWRRVHKGPSGAKSGSATESARQASPRRLTCPSPGQSRGQVDATGRRPRDRSPSRPPYSGTP